MSISEKKPLKPLPSFPDSFFTSLILWTALFPAASCLQDNSKHREERESKQDQRDKGEKVQKRWLAYHEYKGVCSQTAHFLLQFAHKAL